MSIDPTISNVVPILTEVVPGTTTGTIDTGPAAHSVAQAAEQAALAAGFVLDEEAVVDQVLESLEKQIDHMFEYRVREALQPVLERLAAAVVEEVRAELSVTLRDVVRRSVNQQVLRQRSGKN